MDNRSRQLDINFEKPGDSELEGQIERITYENEETGYTVAKLSVRGFHDPVTVVGKIVNPNPGEILIVRGAWTDHPKFGRQFRIESHETKVPENIHGIKRYIGSGLIRGIGPVMAERIVKEFGKETLNIIEERINELERIEGIGPKRISMIQKAWEEQKEIRNVMIFLQSHGVGSGHAGKIFKQYGRNSISIVTRNPYRLASDITGIGFNTADRIAEKLGFDKSAPVRAEAGILYILNLMAEEGHVCYPFEMLADKCHELLDVDRKIILGALDLVVQEKRVVIEDKYPDPDQSGSHHRAVYLIRFYTTETGVAENLTMLALSPKNIREINKEKAIDWVQKQIGLNLAQKQVEAVLRAVSDKVMVITGGPGTGKTTIINAVIRIYRELRARILLAAPTGRASKRMSEATGFPAKTIHRMLEFSHVSGSFQRNRDNPLDADVIILDEVSMIDIILMHHFLKAVPEKATLIMVGDANQLPSVGAGSVLGDIIRSGTVPVVKLRDIFRQAGESQIILNAHKINNGIVPELEHNKTEPEDFFFIEQENPEQALNIIIELVTSRIPGKFGFDPVEDIQVLSPMHKGIVGTGKLNRTLQEALNPSKTMITLGDREFRLNDKVMQIKNNYDKDVFNGDIGRVSSIDPEARQMVITFDRSQVPYDFSELDEVVLAYAISVHKSQGSEYPAVVLPIMNQHYVLLQRNLIYTAITRGKKLVVIVGGKKALAMGIKNNKIMKRFTFLSERLINVHHILKQGE